MIICSLLIIFASKLIRVSANDQAPLLSSSFLGDENAPSTSNAVKNAVHIFNSIHGALRQWDNSLHHNGMSFYPVTVAENTLFYHGGVKNSPLSKVGWVAFEEEHAEFFIRLKPPVMNNETQYYLGHVDEQNYTGYISTYYNPRPLKNVIYIDGISAAKSSFGTLDTQDRALLRDTDFKKHDGVEDLHRAQALCKLLPHVEGIIRMELGFELILCDISASLELLSITSHPQNYYRNKTENVFWRSEYMRGVSKRYSSIGSQKVSADFSSMLSAYFYSLNLTNPDPKKASLPRINPEEIEKITRLRDDVVSAFRYPSRPHESIAWQGIVDELVIRYSDRLAYMESMKSDKREMLLETKFLIERFINRTAVNLTASEEQCTSIYLLPALARPIISPADELLYEAVKVVSRRICSLIFEVRELLISRNDTAVATEAKSKIRDLMKWLDWSRWKECGRCNWDEVCFVAIWPWGTQEDHDHPNCRKIDQWWPTLDYWDVDFGNNKTFMDDPDDEYQNLGTNPN